MKLIFHLENLNTGVLSTLQLISHLTTLDRSNFTEEKRRECRVLKLLNFTTPTKDNSNFHQKSMIMGEESTAVKNVKHMQSENTATLESTNGANFVFKKSVLDLTSCSEGMLAENPDLLSKTSQAAHLVKWSHISDHYMSSNSPDSFDNIFW